LTIVWYAITLLVFATCDGPNLVVGSGAGR
jgi:hypothetical protein